MGTFIKTPVLTLPGMVATPPTIVASLPWSGAGGGSSRPYQWLVSLSITPQIQSSIFTRQSQQYNGIDINVGMWIANTNTGQAWQITSVAAKTASSIVCTVQDVFRYNTYRDNSKQGRGQPVTGNYIIFTLSEDGNLMIDPVPSSGTGPDFLSNLLSRFQYIDTQYDFSLSQPGGATVTFQYGDIVAIHEPSQTFVLSNSADPSTNVGRVTAIDETSTIFTINPLGKIFNSFNSLPGQVGSLLYTDPSNPGGLTATVGGTEIYLKLRNATSSVTTSSSFVSSSTSITTAGNTFTVNTVLATVGGTGSLTNVRDAINTTTTSSGVSAALSGSGPFTIVLTAIDARAINLADVLGSTIFNVGLVSVENGIKAAVMSISASGGSAPPIGLLNSYGFVFTQASAITTWTIAHNAGSLNVSAQIYDNSSKEIFPDEITVIDLNTIQVSFQAAQAGNAQLTIFK